MAVIEQSVASCTSCGESLESGWLSCPACGSATNSGTLLSCPHCGKGVKANWRLCPECQTNLGGNVTPCGNSAGSSAFPPPRSGTEESQVFGATTAVPYPAERGRLIEPPIVAGDILGGRYTIQTRLGAGGFGAVYQASDSVTKEDVALKIVVAAEGEGKAQRAIEQILHEFKLRQKISDVAHIVKCGDPRPCNFKGLSLVLLPMELAAGGSIRQWLARCESIDGRRTEGLALFRQACLGVKAIHDAGLVHLDIKPENILLSDGKAKITDFGIGRFGAADSKSNPDQLLRQGVGTPQYMSPEQFRTARQKDIGPSSDIYTLGVVLYEILDGVPPFDGSPVELRDKHLTVPPAPLTGVAERWWGIVERCLAKAPAERYPSVEALLKDLHRVQQGVAAGVDVACPKCRHINSNAEHKVCEACLAGLDSMFRPCPDCSKDVRLDVERCSGCGTAVQVHYVRQARLSELEQLKLENLVEAIELLELMVREGSDTAKEVTEDSIATLRKMRKDQQRICEFMEIAENATSEGAPDQALDKWRAVLDIVPRHRVASEKAVSLERLLSEFQDHLSRGLSLTDQAKFAEGELCIQRCLELIPQSAVARQHLQESPRRAHAYAAAIQEAHTHQKAKHVVAALDHVGIALIKAPQSAEALSLRTRLETVIRETDALLNRAKQKARRAQFDEAEKDFQNIEERRGDIERLDTLKAEWRKNKGAYSHAMDECDHAARQLNLGTAVEKVERALKICPDSSPAQSTLKKLRGDQERASQHLQKSKSLLPTADFAGSAQELDHARGLWLTMPGLNEAGVNIKSTQSAYERHMADAQRALAKKAYEEGRIACEKAHKVCSDSEQPKRLYRRINDEEAAEKLRREKKAQRASNRRGTLWRFSKIALLVIILLVVLGVLARLAMMYWAQISGLVSTNVIEHTNALIAVWGGLLIVSTCIHRARFTNFYRRVLAGQFDMRADRMGAAWLVAALLLALLSGLPSVGFYYVTEHYIEMTRDASIAVGTVCGVLIQIAALIYAITSRCRWRLV